MEPTAALLVLKKVVDTAKQLYDLSSKIKDAEIRNLVADLYNNIADLKMEMATLKEDNLRLRAELDSKTKAASLDLKKGDGGYYTVDGDGPFCSGCYDSNQKLSRLGPVRGAFAKLGNWKCPVCENYFWNK